MTPLIIISIYLALLLTLGTLSSLRLQKTRDDFMLASHSIGPVLMLLSLFGTTMTAFALVGSTGEAFTSGIVVYGLLASSSGIVHSLCFFLLGTRLWALGRKYGYATQIQFFRDRLGSNNIGLVLFPILVALLIPYLLIGVTSSGVVIQNVTSDLQLSWLPGGAAVQGIPSWLGSLAICLIVLAYVFAGGMRGTAWANAFQTLVFLVLGVATFCVIAYRLGGQDGLWANLQTMTAQVQESRPEMLTRAKMPPSMFLSFMLIPLSAGMFPHLFQHWLTARSANSFKLPIVVHPLLILVVWAPCVLVGVWATSAVFQGKPVIGEGVTPNEVLPVMVNTVSGDFLTGLLSAGILAAIMSSLDSQFLCLGTMFSEDIVGHYAGKRLSQKRMVLIARAFVVLVVAVTYLFSLNTPRRVFSLGIWCFGGFAALVPLALAAVYWRRLTKMGAYASILAAGASWATFFYLSGFAANKYAVKLWLPQGGEWQAYPMQPVVVMVACSSLALVVGSLLSAPPEAERVAKFFAHRARK